MVFCFVGEIEEEDKLDWKSSDLDKVENVETLKNALSKTRAKSSQMIEKGI